MTSLQWHILKRGSEGREEERKKGKGEKIGTPTFERKLRPYYNICRLSSFIQKW